MFVRLRELLRINEETIHLLLAGVVGVMGGMVNVGFYYTNEFLKMLALGQGGDLLEVAKSLPWLHQLLVPAVGGLLAGAVLHWGLRIVGNQGSSNLLEVVVAGNGRLPLRTGLIKTASSLLSISTGASIGREGSITALTATLASKWGQLSQWPPYRLRLLVACGAAAGMAAAYNAPVAGALFAAQIVLGNFSMNLFAPLVLSAVVASLVSRSYFGIEAWYHVPSFDFTSVTQLPWFLFLGVGSGVAGAIFLKMLQVSENQFNRLPLPIYGRLGLAGLVVGAVGLGYPEVWGNGYGAINRILLEPVPLVVVTGMFFAKVMATVLTVGSGAVGGVFTPTLFVGATLGCVFGTLLHHLGWAMMMPTGAFALVGMGSVLAATSHSPLLAMIMVFELSLNYSLMPPLMLACAVSTLVSRRLHPESIYVEPLRRKGLTMESESSQLGAATQQTVGDFMREVVPPLRINTPLREIAQRFLVGTHNYLPVVDTDNRLVGMVALQDIKEFLNAGQELDSVIAYDLMLSPPACLTPSQRLMDALPILLSSELRNIPVVNSLNQFILVGTVSRAEALGVLSQAISKRSMG